MLFRLNQWPPIAWTPSLPDSKSTTHLALEPLTENLYRTLLQNDNKRVSCDGEVFSKNEASHKHMSLTHTRIHNRVSKHILKMKFR